jgi:pimeloyl-ACP methyl ester carboxylesterase
LDWATSLTIVAGLVPRDAYDDDAVRAGAPGRLSLLEMAEMFPPEDVAAEVATMLAPFPCDRALALEHQREQRAAVDQAVLDSIPGAAERMADALVEAVSNGLAGVQADVVDQVTPFGSAVLARIAVPVHLWYGTDDVVTPPVFGEWYARTLPKADLTLIEGAGHYLPFTHWPELLRNA